MGREAKFTNPYSQHVYVRIKHLVQSLLHTDELPEWDVNYGRTVAPFEISAVIVNHITAFSPVMEDRFNIYYRLMKLFVPTAFDRGILSNMYYGKTTREWKKACENKQVKVVKQRQQTPEEIVAEAIGRLKAKANFCSV